MAEESTIGLGVVNVPDAPFRQNSAFPSWAITHFIPVYDPDIDESIHDNAISGFETSSLTTVITTDKTFNTIKGQRIFNLSKLSPITKINPDTGEEVLCKGRWRLGSTREDSQFIPRDPAVYSGGSIQNLNQLGFSYYNIAEWYRVEVNEQTGEITEYADEVIATSIPGLFPDSTTEYYENDGSFQVYDLNFETKELGVSGAKSITSDEYLNFSDILNASGALLSDARDLVQSKVTFSGSNDNITTSSETIQPRATGRFTFEPTAGNKESYKFNKIIFFVSSIPTSFSNDILTLFSPIFFGHLGLNNTLTVKYSGAIGSSVSKVQLNLNFEPNQQQGLSYIYNVNDWVPTIIENVPANFEDVYRKVYGLTESQLVEGSFYEEIGRNLTSSITSDFENISHHWQAQVYPGDIAIGQPSVEYISQSIDGNKPIAEPNMLSPRAKLHITQTSKSTSSYQGTEEAFIAPYFPHLRFSDKTIESGLDFRFMDIQGKVCVDDMTDGSDQENDKVYATLPVRGVFSVVPSYGYKNGITWAIGLNSSGDARDIASQQVVINMGGDETGNISIEDYIPSYHNPIYPDNNLSFAMGTESFAMGSNSFALGERSRTTANNAVAIGPQTLVNNEHGVAIGFASKATRYRAESRNWESVNNTLSENTVNMNRVRHGSFSFGQNAWSDNGISLGYNTSAFGRYITSTESNIISTPPDEGTSSGESFDCSTHGHTCNCCMCIRANYLLLSKPMNCGNSTSNAWNNYFPSLSTEQTYEKYYALAIGLNSKAYAAAAAIGTDNLSLAHDSYIFGRNNESHFYRSLTMGFNNSLLIPRNIEIENTIVPELITIGIGITVTNDGPNEFRSNYRSILMGYGIVAGVGSRSTHINTNSTAVDEYDMLNNSVFIGSNLSNANRTRSVGIGINVKPGHNSIAIGQNNTNTNTSISIGTNINIISNSNFGQITSLYNPGINSFNTAIGHDINFTGENNVVIGRNISLMNNDINSLNHSNNILMGFNARHIASSYGVSNAISMGLSNSIVADSIIIGRYQNVSQTLTGDVLIGVENSSFVGTQMRTRYAFGNNNQILGYGLSVGSHNIIGYGASAFGKFLDQRYNESVVIGIMNSANNKNLFSYGYTNRFELGVGEINGTRLTAMIAGHNYDSSNGLIILGDGTGKYPKLTTFTSILPPGSLTVDPQGFVRAAKTNSSGYSLGKFSVNNNTLGAWAPSYLFENNHELRFELLNNEGGERFRLMINFMARGSLVTYNFNLIANGKGWKYILSPDNDLYKNLGYSSNPGCLCNLYEEYWDKSNHSWIGTTDEGLTGYGHYGAETIEYNDNYINQVLFEPAPGLCLIPYSVKNEKGNYNSYNIEFYSRSSVIGNDVRWNLNVGNFYYLISNNNYPNMPTINSAEWETYPITFSIEANGDVRLTSNTNSQEMTLINDNKIMSVNGSGVYLSAAAGI